MKRVLVLYFSQSGDVADVTKAFIDPIREQPDVKIHMERLRPIEDYPFPWGSITRLMSVFPECHHGGGNGIQPLTISPDEQYDLIILAYQVWHLAPSLPFQDFFKTEYARLLKETKVITLCVCRNMWHSGSETMKRLVRDAGAMHLDNIVASHQGPPMATFVSVPRLLLFGRRDRLWNIFPPAEISSEDINHITTLGNEVAARLYKLDEGSPGPLLLGKGAVRVKRQYIVPELIGYYLYVVSSRVIQFFDRFGSKVRPFVIFLFTLNLLLSIVVGIPAMVFTMILLYPLLFFKIQSYARRLAEPSGE